MEDPGSTAGLLADFRQCPFTGYHLVMTLATKHDLTLGLRDLELRMIKIMVTLTALNIGANALIFTFLA